MNIPVETVFTAQQFRRLNQKFHGVIGAFIHRRRQEQALDIIAAVETDGEFADFFGRKRGAFYVGIAAVGAVPAIENAIVGH